MSPFNRGGLLGGLRGLAKKLRRRRSSSSSSKKTSPSSSACPYADSSTSCSSSSSPASASSSTHRSSDIRRVFAEYDRDDDGRISLPELTQMVQAIGDCQSESDAAAEAAAMMEVADLDRDGYIGFEEFETLMTTTATKAKPSPGTAACVLAGVKDNGGDRLRQGLCGCHEQQGWCGMGPGDVDEEEDLRLAFALYDRDGDGVITAQEIHAVLTRVMEASAITLADCRRMVRAVDRDGDGVVGFLDFAAMMTAAPQPCACH